MYRYDEFDQDFVNARVAEFSDQVERRLAGEITEDQFRPLRLMNGVYLQLHAYMLRVAIPYGTLNARQMRMLAHIARTYDKGYGHFTTRQNIQYNWPALSDMPAILADLAQRRDARHPDLRQLHPQRHRRPFRRGAADEVADPRPYAEILRQWSTFHPEFSYLPRKFKIAVTGASRDRAAIQVHDIGLHLKKNETGELGFAVYVGGGQGRTPIIAKKIRDFLPEEHLLSYTTAIMRVYNLHGRRDNKYKARIKILVHETGAEEFARQVEAEWAALKDGQLTLPDSDIRAIEAYFAPPALASRPEGDDAVKLARLGSRGFSEWLDQNVVTHRNPDYAIVTISLKGIGEAPGDATDEQMDAVADIAERYAFDEIRVSHEQNLILPHVARADLKAVYDELVRIGLATANSNLITDIIACPGLDYCALANARSIPISQRISERLAPEAPARHRRAEAQDLRLHQRLRPSPCRPHRHPRRREEGRGTLPDHARRLRRRKHLDRRDHRPRLRPGRDHRRHRDDRRHLSGLRTRPVRKVPRRLSPRRPRSVQGGALCWRSQGRLRAASVRSTPRRPRPPRHHCWRPATASWNRRTSSRCRSAASATRGWPCLLLRRGFGRAAAHDRRGRLEPAGHLPRHRQAFRRDAGLPRRAGRRFRPARHPQSSRRRPRAGARSIPDGTLHRTDTDACCNIRKVEPMARGVEPFGAWFTGRKRFQAATRNALPVFEAVGTRIRINPLARWTTADLADYMRRHDLRENPLVAYGYLSIGCFPCTSRLSSRARTRARAAGPVRPRPSAASTCRISIIP